MRTALMQPYFFPYLGYFQMIHCVDQFIVYDNVQYLKGGWVNRNRILLNGKPAYITLPIEADSVTLNINQRRLSVNQYEKGKRKILGQLQQAYRKAPHYADVSPLIEAILEYDSQNMANFLVNSLHQTCDYLGIDTPIRLSSELPAELEALDGQERVIAICEATNTTCYVNAIGGKELYSAEDFSAKGIELKYIEMKDITYNQNSDTFERFLSIIDVMMFNDNTTIQELLGRYELIGA